MVDALCLDSAMRQTSSLLPIEEALLLHIATYSSVKVSCYLLKKLGGAFHYHKGQW